MSLVGSLEDLGLGDILQIVSLSRKSGVLNLSWGPRKGRILFKDGQVVSAYSSHQEETLHSLLKKHGVLTPDVEAKANSTIRTSGNITNPKSLLIELGLDAEAVNKRIREHIEVLIFHFFSWTEGNFSFELMEQGMDETEINEISHGIFLDMGLNPQFLAMEGTRQEDERRREVPPDGALPPPGGETPATMPPAAFPDVPPQPDPSMTMPAIPQPVAPSAPPEPQAFTTPVPSAPPAPPASEAIETPVPSAPPAAQSPTTEMSMDATQPVGDLYKASQQDAAHGPPKVIIIDDDPIVLAVTEKKIKEMGISFEGISNPNELITRVEQIVSSGMGLPVVIVDLFMPRRDGEGILGGLEAIENLKKINPGIPIIMISDYKNEMAEKQAFGFGLEVYSDKPKRSQINTEDGKETPELRDYLQNLELYVPELLKKAAMASGAPLPAPCPPDKVEQYDLRREILADIGIDDTDASYSAGEGREKVAPSRGLDLLKAMINELNDPSFSGQITLMVLRFAAEFMNRAIIFLVTKDQVAGLGQFGVQLNGIDPERQVRRMRIPLSEPSIFREIVQKRMVIKSAISDTTWNEYLFTHLGGLKPKEVFAAPIITGGKIAAILYGDNVPEDTEIGDTDGLEIFLSQAGLAMERAFLERRVKELVDST